MSALGACSTIAPVARQQLPVKVPRFAEIRIWIVAREFARVRFDDGLRRQFLREAFHRSGIPSCAMRSRMRCSCQVYDILLQE